MEQFIRPIGIGAAVGAIAAALYFGASALPHALADEPPLETMIQSANDLSPARGFDPNSLVRINDEAWSITADDSVSLTPLYTQKVRKIGYGVSTVVTISTTSTGVYSSDAITSPHVLYPGITATRVYPAATDDDSAQSLAYWSPGHGWVPSPALSAGSFAMIVPFEGGVLLRSPQGNCVLVDGIAVC